MNAATDTIVQSTRLLFCEGSSDKEYKVVLSSNGESYDVTAFYGRRGQGLDSTVKAVNVSHEKAQRAYTAVVNEKLAKRYTLDSSSETTTAALALKIPDDTGLRPMLLNAISEDEALRYIRDPHWMLQPKWDGTRALAHRAASGIIFANRRGVVANAPNEVLEALMTLPAETIVDGELVNGVFVAFDLLMLGGNDLRSHTAIDRYRRLAEVFTMLAPSPAFTLTEAITDPQESEAWWNDVSATRTIEGVVFKDGLAPYIAGRPASGGPALKCKFWHDASCIVTGINAKNSVSLGMLDGTVMIDMGNVTVKTNQDMPTIGDIIDVKYLYIAGVGGSLYQPEFLRVRTDLSRDDCQVAQLHYKTSPT